MFEFKTCSQIKSADFETSSRYEDHTCSCENNEWWTTGGDFGNGNDPCAPVLKNWLIIVIAVIAFLLLILLIIGKNIFLIKFVILTPTLSTLPYGFDINFVRNPFSGSAA